MSCRLWTSSPGSSYPAVTLGRMRDLEHSHLIGRARLLRREGKTYDEIRAVIGPVRDERLQRWLRGIPRPLSTRRGPALPEARREARRLRAQGMTYDEIAVATGASVGSLSLWLADMPLNRFAPPSRSRDRFQATCERSRIARFAAREAAIGAGAKMIGSLTDRELFLVGTALYWAEGAKSKPWRPADRVTFINSDPTVIQVMLRWLDGLGIDRSRLKLRLSIHESADVAAAEQFWSEITGVDLAQFSRATLKRHNPKTVRRNTGVKYVGCLIVDVSRSADVYRAVEAAWRGIAVSGDGIPVVQT